MRTICRETAGGIQLIFIVATTFFCESRTYYRIAVRDLASGRRPRNEHKLRKRRRPTDRNSARWGILGGRRGGTYLKMRLRWRIAATPWAGARPSVS